MKQPSTTTTIGQHWGAAVAAVRADLGLSQSQFAEVCGVTQQTISRIELGAQIPHDRLKLTIAQRTGRKPGVLFAWPDAPLSAA